MTDVALYCPGTLSTNGRGVGGLSGITGHTNTITSYHHPMQHTEYTDTSNASMCVICLVFESQYHNYFDVINHHHHDRKKFIKETVGKTCVCETP